MYINYKILNKYNEIRLQKLHPQLVMILVSFVFPFYGTHALVVQLDLPFLSIRTLIAEAEEVLATFGGWTAMLGPPHLPNTRG